MRYTSTIHVSDVLDQVVVSVRVQGHNGWDEVAEEDYGYTLQIPGVGAPCAREWLRNALCAALEHY